MVATIVKMPKWGLTMTTGIITDWLKSEGDEVSEGDPLLTVETEKAVNDVEAPSDGVLLKIVAESGAEIPVSGPMAIIAAPGESLSQDEIDRLLTTASISDGTASSADRATRAPRERSAARRDRSGRINASPAARKLAAELGVDLATVEATGPGGRITSDDVERAAASNDIGPREERITLEDGRTIHALVAGPRGGHSMVFIHGLGGSQSTWQLQLASFASEARLAALDLPGHGQSDKAPTGESDHTLSGLASAVAESIRAVGTGQVTVVGHSLGGAVALELALSHAELVRSLVLVNSAGLGPDISQELTTLMSGEPGHDTARTLLDLFFEEKKYVTDRGIEEMARFQLVEGGWDAQQAIAQSVFAGDCQQIDLTDRLPEVTQPVLLVWGAADRVIPLSHAFKAVSSLPDASLVVLAGAGHVPQVERADELVRAIRRFVAALDA
jgi:pimeloyl-ACP methyl ester carboxylesterase